MMPHWVHQKVDTRSSRGLRNWHEIRISRNQHYLVDKASRRHGRNIETDSHVYARLLYPNENEVGLSEVRHQN